MVAYATPPTAVAGANLPASDWNTKVRDSIEFCHTPPGAAVYHSVAQSLANGVATALAFNSEREDTDTIHDTVTNNTRLTCKTAGRYLITGSAQFSLNGTGYRQLLIRLNGTTYLTGDSVPASAAIATALTTVRIAGLFVNDYVELVAAQSSGGALNVDSAAAYSPEFAMSRLG